MAIYLDAPLLHICDEPVVLNAPVGGVHIEDCFRTEQEIKERTRCRIRQIPKRNRKKMSIYGRTVYFSSTRPTGHGVADEILLPISPSAALLWGPLSTDPQVEFSESEVLRGDDATRFARMANDALAQQALDWIVSRIDDASFCLEVFPPPGPLMKVCDGTNAASIAINAAPKPYRPFRLSKP